MVSNLLNKILRFGDQSPVQDVSTKSFIVHTRPLGSIGTRNQSGYPDEEYLQALTGTARADLFDKMRRSDGTVKMCLAAVKSPIKGATWEVKKADKSEFMDEATAESDAEFVRHVLFNDHDKTWRELLHEILTEVDFGFSVFEIVDKVVLNHQKFGSYNGIKSLAYRSARTIERWNLDKETGALQSVTQYAFGDLQRLVDIPAEFLLVFSMDKEGANYEGISALRPCYGNWWRKNNYLKLNGIGIEKFAIPTPLVKVPEGKESGEQFDALTTALEYYMAHEKGYLTYPSGWEIDLRTNVYDPSKVEQSIDNEDKRMVKSFMANFLELGLNGFGSKSLSFDLSDFFLGTLDHIAEGISETINKVLIPRIIQLNRGPRPAYPTLKHSGISDRAGSDLATVMKNLVDSNILSADDVLESHVRKRFDLPEQDKETKRAKMVPGSFQPATNQLMEKIKKMKTLRG